MAEKLEQVFRIVEERSGMNGRMKLVLATKITRKLAQEMDDDPKLVEKMKAIASGILGHDIEIDLKSI